MIRSPASLLLHRGRGPAHWDLLLANGPRATTLRLWPETGPGLRWAPLPAHRLCYLDYSGPVPGGRGQVQLIWRGLLAWHRLADGGLCLRTRNRSCQLAADGRVLAGAGSLHSMQPCLQMLNLPKRMPTTPPPPWIWATPRASGS